MSVSKEPESSVAVTSPYRAADFDHWAKCPFWTPIEAACLSLGFDPTALIPANLEELRCQPEDFERLEKRVRLIARAAEINHLPEKFTPLDGLRWLKQIEESVPDELFKVVSRMPRYGDGRLRQVQNADVGKVIELADDLLEQIRQRENKPNPSSKTKMIDTLERMTLAMSIGGYGHDPKDTRSKVYAEISSDSQKAGVSVHTDTVRAHLKRAAEKHWEDPEA